MYENEVSVQNTESSTMADFSLTQEDHETGQFFNRYLSSLVDTTSTPQKNIPCKVCKKRHSLLASVYNCSDGATKICTQCIDTNKCPDLTTCTYCNKLFHGTCANNAFLHELCPNVCCTCITAHQNVILGKIKLKKPMAFIIESRSVLACIKDPFVACAYGYQCKKCNKEFIVPYNCQDIYHLLQQFFCKRPKCQKFASTFYKLYC